jgi:ADP-ribosylation factor-like protein 8
MSYLFSGFFEWIKGLFWTKHLEVTIVGLQVSTILFSITWSSRTSILRLHLTGKWKDQVRRFLTGHSYSTPGNQRYICLYNHSLVNALSSGQWSEDVVPTVAFGLRQVKKGNVVMKIWDVAVSLATPHHSSLKKLTVSAAL